MAERELSRKESVILYKSQFQMMEELPPDEFKKIVLSLFDYSVDGLIPDFSGCADSLALTMAFKVIASQIDRDNAAYQKKCKQQSEKARKRWEILQNTVGYHGIPQDTANTDTDKDTDTVTDTVTDTDKDIIDKAAAAASDPVTREKEKKVRHKHGEYKHVLLTEKQYADLIADYGEVQTAAAIKKVDEYCEKHGKTYKNYNLVIRDWGIEEKAQVQQDDGLLDGIL